MSGREFLTQPSLDGFVEPGLEVNAAELEFLIRLPQITEASSLAVLDLTASQPLGPRTLSCVLSRMTKVTIFSQMADFSDTYRSKKDIPRGIVIKVPFDYFSHLSEQQISFLSFLFRERLGKTPAKLARKVWFVETGVFAPLSREETDRRKEFAQKVGLVDFASGYDKVSHFVWSKARLPKQKEYREVDLTKKPWYPFLIGRIREEAFLAGYKEIDITELEGEAKKCRNAFFAMGRIRDSRGVVFECYCGCKTLTDWEGSIKEISHCSDEKCPGLPHKDDIIHNRRELAQKEGIYLNQCGEFLVGTSIPYIAAMGRINRCGDCGEDLVIDRKVIGERGPKKIVKSTLRCLGHGVIGSSKTQLVNPVFIVNWRAR